MERWSTKIKKNKALVQYALTEGNIKQSAKNAHVGRTQFYQWLKTDDDFRNRCEQILSSIKEYNKTQRIKEKVETDEDFFDRMLKEIEEDERKE